MDEKTAELRDLFVDVTDEETVTESQQAGRGSVATDEADVDARLRAVIEQLHDTFGTDSSLPRAAQCSIVRGFYAGKDDEAIAADLDCDTETVRWTRLSLHLLQESERSDPDRRATVRQQVSAHPDVSVDDRPLSVVAEELVSESGDWHDHSGEPTAGDGDRQTREHEVGVALAALRSRRVSHRYRTAFEEILTDADLTVQFTADAHEDGLEGATDGAEVDVDF